MGMVVMMKKIAFVVSSPMTAVSFLNGHFRALSEFYRIDLIADFKDEICGDDFKVSSTIRVNIRRDISPIADLLALAALIKIFVTGGYDAVHTVTPKAGLLGMLAAWIARVPVRHHTFTGQVWVTRAGLMRQILRLLDKVIFFCSTGVLVDSPSQRAFLVSEKVVSLEGSLVLAKGSISGVDVGRFFPNPALRARVREQYAVNDGEILFLFLGRINKDKGVPELIAAFRGIYEEFPHAKLMLVGPDEQGILAEEGLLAPIEDRLLRVDYTREPEAFFNAADLFCLPSHREGFGTVVIEAAACGIPSIASNIYGLSDAVEDGVTGLLHEACSVGELRKAMARMIVDQPLRERLGRRALERVRKDFASEVVEKAMVAFYQSSLAETKGPC
ncbi:glycosyltransferase [Desulfurivibrio sp. D14AmB]|uniref:glycosyltransferase n=1 Tax=Desulfurivibrio sp. D14AmB TaxID=3374370 RepID=UPI00376EBC55